MGNGTITKPFGTVLDDLAINQPTGVSLLLKIESAATEEDVDSDPDVGGKEFASRFSLCPGSRRKFPRLPRSTFFPTISKSAQKPHSIRSG